MVGGSGGGSTRDSEVSLTISRRSGAWYCQIAMCCGMEVIFTHRGWHRSDHLGKPGRQGRDVNRFTMYSGAWSTSIGYHTNNHSLNFFVPGLDASVTPAQQELYGHATGRQERFELYSQNTPSWLVDTDCSHHYFNVALVISPDTDKSRIEERKKPANTIQHAAGAGHIRLHG